MTVPLVLSASSVVTFLRCGQQWYFAHVAGIKSPPSLRQALGVAAHAAIEVNMRQKIDSTLDLELDDVLDAFSTNYDTEIAEVETPEEDPGDLKDRGVRLMTLHHTEVAPKIQPLWVEQPVQFNVNNIPYSGIVDVVDDRHRVRDWKTTGQKPRPGSYLLNMVGYALGYRQATGETETEVVLDYLVRTKVPQYIPIASGGPIDQTAIVSFAGTIEQVAAAIQAGTFVPNGLLSGACSWCGYKNICPAYQSSQSVV